MQRQLTDQAEQLTEKLEQSRKQNKNELLKVKIRSVMPIIHTTDLSLISLIVAMHTLINCQVLQICR